MAYAFARLRFFGRRYGLFGLLLIQMFPIGIAIPAYYFFLLRLSEWTSNRVGLETYSGLILLLAGTGMAFYAWLFKGYIDSTPKELEEAAFVDGATRLQALRYVILPLVRPMIAVVFLLVFIATYSEYVLTSIVFTVAQDKFTLPLGLRGFIFQRFTENWGEFAAAAVDRVDTADARLHPHAAPPRLRAVTRRGQGIKRPISRREQCARDC